MLIRFPQYVYCKSKKIIGTQLNTKVKTPGSNFMINYKAVNFSTYDSEKKLSHKKQIRG